MRWGEKIKKGVSRRKVGSISLPWEPQILQYSLGWEKAFRIPQGKKPPRKTSEEGGIDGGLGQDEKLGAIWPLKPHFPPSSTPWAENQKPSSVVGETSVVFL